MFRLVQILWYDLIRFYKHVQTCSNIMISTNMSRHVQILRYDLIRFYKHVQTCSNIMTRFDTFLQTCPDLFICYDMIWYDSKTCPDLFKYYDTIWYNSTNMSRLVQILWYDLIGFYKHVQICSNITIRFDTILQTCLNLSMILWYNLIQFYQSQHCWNISQYLCYWLKYFWNVGTSGSVALA